MKSEVKVTVTEYGVVQPINFANEIVPIFTKAGCNSGGCHGKRRPKRVPPIPARL